MGQYNCTTLREKTTYISLQFNNPAWPGRTDLSLRELLRLSSMAQHGVGVFFYFRLNSMSKHRNISDLLFSFESLRVSVWWSDYTAKQIHYIVTSSLLRQCNRTITSIAHIGFRVNVGFRENARLFAVVCTLCSVRINYSIRSSSN